VTIIGEASVVTTAEGDLLVMMCGNAPRTERSVSSARSNTRSTGSAAECRVTTRDRNQLLLL
jgi:hypothetical protein